MQKSLLLTYYLYLLKIKKEIKANQRIIQENQIKSKENQKKKQSKTNNNTKKAYSLGFQLTTNQLKKWQVKYHKLIMGKPSYDLIIDDLSIYFKNNWYKDIDKYL